MKERLGKLAGTLDIGLSAEGTAADPRSDAAVRQGRRRAQGVIALVLDALEHGPQLA